MNYEFVKDYKNNEKLKESFNKLAIKTFELDFRSWYEKGYWTNDYIPYSYSYNNEIIANVSVNKMDLIIDDKIYKALQIGTVMTDERFKNQGLSRKLLNYVLEEYKDKVQFIYLFANEDVLSFYPKFGFKRCYESEYILDVSKYEKLNKIEKVEKLDFNTLEDFAKNKKTLSTKLDCINNNLLMFYFTIALSENIYYIKEQNIFIIMEEDEDTIHLYDIISKENYNINDLIKNIINKNTKNIKFYFTANNIKNIKVNKIENNDDALFIYGQNPLKENFAFPITSHC